MAVKKWAGHILTAIIIIMFLITLWFTLSAKILGGTPNLFGFQIMNVLSGSMEPSISTGSIIAIRPGENFTDLKEGDVITFRSIDDQSMIITHRIKEVQKVGSSVQYITKGDANDGEDPTPIPASNILGQYTGFTIPLLGYFLTFVRSKIGIVIFMVVPGVLMILWQLISIWRLFSKLDDEEKDKEAASEKLPQNV